MELALQLGYGSMQLARNLTSEWGGALSILSPRDSKADQLVRLSRQLRSLPGGRVWLDPQFYLPQADHPRLVEHSFWPNDYDTGSFWSGSELDDLVDEVVSLNQELGADAIVLPGAMAQRVSLGWIDQQRRTALIAKAVSGDLALIATVALSADALRSEDQVDLVLDGAREWPVDGIYVVAEHPPGQLLVTDEHWVVGLADLVAGLASTGFDVTVGYANQQQLMLSAAGASRIASGTWQNVRAFSVDKFTVAYGESFAQAAIWYYCPQLLTEFGIPALDLAYRNGSIRNLSKPVYAIDDVAALFDGRRPSTVEFGRSESFRHYLRALKLQVDQSRRRSFEATVEFHQRWIQQATAGIRGPLGEVPA